MASPGLLVRTAVRTAPGRTGGERLALNEVSQVGASISIQSDGWYAVTIWHRLKGGGRHHECLYADLSWTEAIDVVLAEVHGRRPGWQLGEGWSQPPLPF